MPCTAKRGQMFVASPVLGRPEAAAAGQIAIVPAGPADAIEKLAPLNALMGRRTFPAGDEAGRRRGREAREQHADRLRDRGDGRGVLARAQVRRRSGRVLRGVHGRPVLGARVQGLRQHHREGALRPGRVHDDARLEGHGPHARGGSRRERAAAELERVSRQAARRDGERRRESAIGPSWRAIKRARPASTNRRFDQ